MPLLGFAGAPFTLASYLVEGGPSRTHERTKALMLGEPARLGRADGRARRDRAAAPPRAGRRRRAGAAGLRLVGGCARPRCLRAVRVPAHAAPVRGPGGPRHPHDPFRRGDGGAPRVDASSGRRRDRRGLAHAARCRVGPRGSRRGRAGQPGSGRAVGAVGCGGGRDGSRARVGWAHATDTSSISATACRRTPIPTRSDGSWIWSTSEPNATRFRVERLAGGRARDGVRDRERPGRHRALLHRHPWWPDAVAGTSRGAEGAIRRDRQRVPAPGDDASPSRRASSSG